MNAPSRCLYCGSAETMTLEHYIPVALGGSRRARFACRSCNNGVLSDLDKELAERSPLALLAAQELHKATRFTWDVDHADNNLLLEAHADLASGAMKVWPQIIVDGEGTHFRGDAAEIQQLGPDNFPVVFVRHLLKAFRTISARRPRLVFERVDTNIPPVYRYPPRVFATRGLRDFNDRMHFQCRYLHAADKRKVLHCLADWDSGMRFRPYEISRGSELPGFCLRFDGSKVVRGLLKLALNLLHFANGRDGLDTVGFGPVVEVVTGRRTFAPRLLKTNGFTAATDLAPLNCPSGSHKVRLLHDGKFWHVYFAFFSGAAGACVRFPGPTNEAWRTADIVVPLRSADWQVVKSVIIQPLAVRVEWKDLTRILPSVPIANVNCCGLQAASQ